VEFGALLHELRVFDLAALGGFGGIDLALPAFGGDAAAGDLPGRVTLPAAGGRLLRLQAGERQGGDESECSGVNATHGVNSFAR
jgi:hypothetical protein